MKCYQTILLRAALNDSSLEQGTASVRRWLLLGRPFSLCVSLSTWQHQKEAELSVVLVSGLVVLLLYNEPGRLADHSLKEL